jgi:Mrp family chromosome partitioning ATPase
VFKELASSFADEFYRLDRTLFPRDSSSRSRAIQFTASHFSEGVTSTTLAFATFLAKVHSPNSIIVVEANIRRPSLQEILKIETDKSFAGILQNSEPLEEAIQRTNDHGFSVLPAVSGFGSERGLEREERLENLEGVLASLKRMYRYILLDSPPVIPFIDSTIITSMSDGVVFVVESNQTRSQVVRHAIEKLKSGGGEILGIILNKREFHIPRWIYRFL